MCNTLNALLTSKFINFAGFKVILKELAFVKWIREDVQKLRDTNEILKLALQEVVKFSSGTN